MKLLIVSTAPFIFKDEKCFAYSPYVKELVVWEKYATEISFCCPIWKTQNGLLVSEVPFEIKKYFELIDFNLNNFANSFKAIFQAFFNGLIIFKAMRQADHIHLRCPGNIGLLGCFVQILFPYKPKTAKYAGNWDPKSKQPWSYRLQKWILRNTFLTRNMQVLVYGEWAGNSSNIKPFFTATYTEVEKVPLLPLELDSSIRFVFVGSLVKGKNPMYAVQLIEKLLENRNNIFLDIYGEGVLSDFIKAYMVSHELSDRVVLHGNRDAETLKAAYQQSHFVILPSKSEGWPKALAEGMFWGCVPVATAVSCVPFMLDCGNRGILLKMDLDRDIESFEGLIKDYISFESTRNAAAGWSRQYTLDHFDAEIKKLLQ